MLGTLFILLIFTSTYFFALAFGRRIFSSSIEIFAVSLPLGIALFTGLTSLLSIFLPVWLASTIITGLFAVCGIFAVVKISLTRSHFWLSENLMTELRTIITPVAVIMLLLTPFILNGFTVEPNGTWTIGGKKAIDTLYHISQVVHIGEAQKWHFEEPNFAGEFIRYPYFINFFSAVLLKTGLPLNVALHLPEILMTLSWSILLFLLLRSLDIRPVFSLIVACGVLFGGGFGYLAYIKYNTGDLLLRANMVWPWQNIAYPGLVPGFLLLQRTFMLGFGLFLASILLFMRGIRTQKPEPLWIASLLTSLLPFSHMHSFVAVGTFTVTAFGYLFITRNKISFLILRNFGYPVAILTLPQLAALVLLPKFPLPDTTSLRLGWMSDSIETGGMVLRNPNDNYLIPWLSYMWTNFGPLLLSPLGVLALWKKIHRPAYMAVLGAGALSLWLIPNILKFQTWDFDNNKLFVFAILTSLCFLALGIQNLTGARKTIATIVFCMGIAISVPSSFIALGETLKNPSKNSVNIFTYSEQLATTWLKKNTSPNTVILTSVVLLDKSEVVQILPVIASGRLSTSSYKFIAYTHGIDSYDRRQVIQDFFEEPAKNTETIKTIPADYLIFDDSLRKQYPKLEKELARLKYPVVFQDGSIRIFHLTF